MTDESPDWELVEKMVGLPDFAVCLSMWPWPDGGWMAGVCLTDREWAEEQKLPSGILALVETGVFTKWDMFDGFADGVNTHGPSAAEAIVELWAKVKGPDDE